MYEVQRLARIVHRARFQDLGTDALIQLKIRVFDILGVAIDALDAKPIISIRRPLGRAGGAELSTLIGGGRTSPERAAFYSGALSRYLVLMNAYLAKGETNHPSDNLGAALACAEFADASGQVFLTALAVAYQVHAQLSDVASVRAKGFDHTTQGTYAVAAATAKALRIDPEQIANAIAISDTANNALRVTCTGNLSHSKGVETAKESTFTALLASYSITRSQAAFAGNKGLKESIAGSFEIDGEAEDLEQMLLIIIKKHNTEIHSQPALDAALDLRAQDGFSTRSIELMHLCTFAVAIRLSAVARKATSATLPTRKRLTTRHLTCWPWPCSMKK